MAAGFDFRQSFVVLPRIFFMNTDTIRKKIGVIVMGQYFKGYYFKCCDGDKAVALIPAKHTGGGGLASLQVITDNGAYAIPYPGIKFGRKNLRIRLDGNISGHSAISQEAR